MSIYIVLLLVLPLGKALNAEVDYNTALFTLEGKTTSTTSYGHLLFDLKIQEAKDLMATLIEIVEATGPDSNPQSKKLERMVNHLDVSAMEHRLDLLCSILGDDLAQTSHLEDLGFEGNLERLLNPDASQSTANQVESSDGGRRLGRSVTAVAAAGTTFVTSLASFGVSLFTNRQLTSITDSIHKNEAATSLVALQADENTLHLATLQHQMEVFNASLFAMAARSDRNTQALRQATRALMAQHAHNAIMTFRMEFQAYLTGLSSLMDHRLEPALISPDRLDAAYQDLIRKARTHHLSAISEDAGIIFQSTTSVVRRGEKLIAIVHVPFLGGEVMNLYRYLPAPVVLQPGFVANIQTDSTFIALDSSGAVAKQLTAQQLATCSRIHNVFHCPRQNVLSKDLGQLCLFNLFHQRLDKIESTCSVTISEPMDHIIQLSGSTFRVMVPKPTQLIMDCVTGPRHKVVEGVILVNLTDECPTASTPAYQFRRSTQIAQWRDVVQLPEISQTMGWFGDITPLLNTTTAHSILKDLQTISSRSVPIKAFKDKLVSQTTDQLLDIYQYTQGGALILVLLYAGYRGVRRLWGAIRLRRRRPLPCDPQQFRQARFHEMDNPIPPCPIPETTTQMVVPSEYSYTPKAVQLAPRRSRFYPPRPNWNLALREINRLAMRENEQRPRDQELIGISPQT